MRPIFLSTLLLFVLGCSKDDDTGFKPKTIVPVEISKFHLPGVSGSVPQQTITVTNELDWETLKESMTDRVQFFSETEIDFEEYIVLAVFDQVYPEGGHSIDITGVVENADDIKVTVERLLPGGQTQVIMQPYHIVKIPKTNKPIVFEAVFED